MAVGISPLDVGRMSLAEFLSAGKAYAAMVDPDNAPGQAPPSDGEFDDMLAAARAKGMLD